MSNTAATKRTRNSASFADVIVFIIAFALFLFGLYLFGAAFSSPEGTEFWVFWGGLLASCFAFLVPMIYHWVRDPRP
jgi:multisubunit Na+/H+ antiporter MnhB subunit